jgi:hypothetical protein
VRKLWDDNGNVVDGKHLRNFITNQYIELFISPGGDQFDEVLNLESHTDMNDALLEPFTVDEIWEALESIGDLKHQALMVCPLFFTRIFGI